MNAYTLASELLKGVDLTPSQLAELRAIDVKYQQHLFALLHGGDAGARAARPTPEQLAELRLMVESDLLRMLTPEQRATVDSRPAR